VGFRPTSQQPWLVQDDYTPWKMDVRTHDHALKWSLRDECMLCLDGGVLVALKRGVVLHSSGKLVLDSCVNGVASTIDL
jgi:hypothetical protein